MSYLGLSGLPYGQPGLRRTAQGIAQGTAQGTAKGTGGASVSRPSQVGALNPLTGTGGASSGNDLGGLMGALLIPLILGAVSGAFGGNTTPEQGGQNATGFTPLGNRSQTGSGSPSGRAGAGSADPNSLSEQLMSLLASVAEAFIPLLTGENSPFSPSETGEGVANTRQVPQASREAAGNPPHGFAPASPATAAKMSGNPYGMPPTAPAAPTAPGMTPNNPASQGITSGQGIMNPNQWDQLFLDSAKKYNNPSTGMSDSELALFMQSLAKTESGFDSHGSPESIQKALKAGSHAGAQGLMQIVPRFHPGVDPWNPQEAVPYSTKLITDSLKRYNGNIAMATSAYNSGGPNNVGKIAETTKHYQRTVDTFNQYKQTRLGGLANTNSNTNANAGYATGGEAPMGEKQQARKITAQARQASQGQDASQLLTPEVKAQNGGKQDLRHRQQRAATTEPQPRKEGTNAHAPKQTSVEKAKVETVQTRRVATKA